MSERLFSFFLDEKRNKKIKAYEKIPENFFISGAKIKLGAF